MSLLAHLLNVSWWVALLAAILGIAIFFSANRRQDKTLQRVGIAIFVIAIILGIFPWVFPSDVQKLEKRSTQLFQTANTKDWSRLRALLDPDTAVDAASVHVAGRDVIVRNITDMVEFYGVHSVSIVHVEGKQTQTLITISMDVTSRQDVTQDRPVLSSWQLDYQQSGEQWILEKITLLRLGDESSNQMPHIFQHMPSAPH